MSSSSVESASYVHVARIRRNACASLVFRGEAQTTRIATVFDRSFGILPVKHLSLVGLSTDLEVKVVGVTTDKNAQETGSSLFLRSIKVSESLICLERLSRSCVLFGVESVQVLC